MKQTGKGPATGERHGSSGRDRPAGGITATATAYVPSCLTHRGVLPLIRKALRQRELTAKVRSGERLDLGGQPGTRCGLMSTTATVIEHLLYTKRFTGIISCKPHGHSSESTLLSSLCSEENRVKKGLVTCPRDTEWDGGIWVSWNLCSQDTFRRPWRVMLRGGAGKPMLVPFCSLILPHGDLGHWNDPAPVLPACVHMSTSCLSKTSQMPAAPQS